MGLSMCGACKPNMSTTIGVSECGSSVDGDDEGALALSVEEKLCIQHSWSQLLEDGPDLSMVRQHSFQSQNALLRLVMSTANQITFGQLEQRYQEQCAVVAEFLNTLIMVYGLDDNEVVAACEQFGQEDAETEIRSSSEHCAIHDAVLVFQMIVQFFEDTQSEAAMLLTAWRRLAGSVIASMKDGAYWAEEKWGVHLATHVAE